MNEFESRLNDRYYEPSFEETKTPKKLPVMEGYPYERKESNFWGGFIAGVFIVGIIGSLIIGGYFVYYVGDDKFKSDVNQNVQLEPKINITSNTHNTYENKFDNKFMNNFTII